MSVTTNMHIPIETLLSLLRAEGLKDIGTRAVLDIQKVLANLDEKQISDFTLLRYYIAPIVCRNKEDQEKFNKIFDQYVEWIRSEKEHIAKIPKKKKRRYIWPLSIAGVSAILLGIWIYTIINSTTPYISLSQNNYWPVGKYAENAIGDSISYDAFIQDTVVGEKYTMDWKLGDSTYNNTRNIQKVYTDTGTYTASVWVKDKTGKIIANGIIQTRVLCGHPPTISIDTTQENNQKIYRAIPSDTAAHVKDYAYKWFINDSLVSTQKIFNSRYRSNKPFTVKLTAYTNTLYCTGDSLTSMLKENQYALIAQSRAKIQQQSAFLTGNFLFILTAVLIPAAGVAWLIFYRWKKIDNKKEKDKKAEPVSVDGKHKIVEGPFFIDFKDQDNKIAPEEHVNKLADGLRKRQLSDVFQLDLKKTIDKTIRGGGFPLFDFSPRTKPVDFLVLIDKEYPDGHLVKLFEYLVERLRSEQVNIILYDYYKEPLYLNNIRYNHLQLSLERLAQLYPDTILFLFTSGEYLLNERGTALKTDIEEKIKLWEHCIIITPIPKKDWSYKENTLQKAGFVLIPADLYQHNLLKILLDFVSLQVESTKQEKMEIPEAYTARHFNFRNFNALQKYLDDALLTDWVSATAIYPHINWKVTVAIGKAIEDLYPEQRNKLVTYKNLLKIARIRWMQDGIIDDTLRLEMLQHIDNATEAAARKAIVTLLEEIKDQFRNNSLAKEAFDLQLHSNKLLLNAYDASNPITDETRIAVKGYVEKGYMDWAQTTYHEEATGTLLKDEYGTRSVSMENYLDVLEKKSTNGGEMPPPDDKPKRNNRVRNFVTAAAFILLAAAGAWLLDKNGKLSLWKTSAATLNVVLQNAAALGQPGTIHMSLQGDSLYEGQRQNDSVFVFNNVVQGKSGGQGLLSVVSTGNNELATNISLDSSYTVTVAAPVFTPRRPLNVLYNNGQEYAAIEQLLNANFAAFDITARQQDFKDSSKVVYYADSQQQMVDSITAILKSRMNITARTERVAGTNAAAQVPVVYLNVTPAKTFTCNTLAINKLPSSLYEIWKGGTSNRLINVNLSSNIIYYSTGDKNTYGTYRIDEVCMSADGVYRIITKAGNDYQVFFIRNVQATAFSLSVCANRYKTKEEIAQINSSYCDRFNTMTLYYSNASANTISANTAGLINFSNAQRDILENNLLKVAENTSVNLEVNINTTVQGAATDSRYDLLKNNFPLGQTRATNSVSYNIRNNPIQWNRKLYKGTPFDRDYVVMQYQAPPDPCSKIYYSLNEAAQAKDPTLVCKLDLQKENLKTVPSQVYEFKNLQELTLGGTEIPQAEIDKLKAALPKCNIKYTIKVAPTTQNKELTLGTLTIDQKGYVDSKGNQLISEIAAILRTNRNSSVRLDATASNAAEQKRLTSGVTDVKNLFYKNGASQKPDQVVENIILQQIQQQQNQQQQANPVRQSNNYTITIIGINWPDNNKKQAY